MNTHEPTTDKIRPEQSTKRSILVAVNLGELAIDWCNTTAPERGTRILEEAAKRARVTAPSTRITTHLETGETAATILKTGRNDTPQSSSPVSRVQSNLGLVDVALALCWVPFAASGWLFRNDPNSTAWLVSATLLISFAHQPLTLALVYGDKRNFDLRRRTFTWSPVVFAGAVLATQHISLTALAVVAGLWNAEHTLMQRYGIMRIHGRKAGQQNAPLDKAVLFSWLALAFVWIAADGRTPGHIAQTGLRGKNRRGLDLLADLQPPARILLPFAAVVAVTLTVRWLRDETRLHGNASRAKRLYTASTAALFLTILVNPVAGFLGYVGSHAIEYFIIVHRSVGPKYASADADGRAPVGYAIRGLGRAGFFAAYIGIVFGALSVLDRYGSPTSYTVVILTLGGMHVFYDGFIWKRPAADRGGMLAVARTSLRP